MSRRSIPKLTLILVLTGALAGAGCYIEVDEEDPAVYGYGDLEVSWTISGSSSAALCDVYEVETWYIEIQGPEHRDVVLDCRANYWSSETDFYDLPEGSYTLHVTAEDPYQDPITTLSTTADVWDDGFVESIELTFQPSDFY